MNHSHPTEPDDTEPFSSRADDAVSIARLAALDPLAYDRVRRVEAAKLGIRPETLDRQVQAARRAVNSHDSMHVGENAIGEFCLNEDGVALAFTEEHKGRLLYDHQSCSWFLWTGAVWKREQTQLAFSWAREVCRAAAHRLEPDDQVKHLLAKASAAAAVERYAKSDRAFAVEADTWDCDPWLLGSPGGTINLRTGDIQAAEPTDRITKLVSVTPAPPKTPHPLWTGFLVQATNGDIELQEFLQRLAGYCLTGDVTEEAMAFLYGDGGTGKGTFISTIVGILADYAVSLPIEVFTAGARLPLEYYRAQMAGARLVTASETEAGATWAESQIKEITGNETPLPARHPYGKPFEFWPMFKVVLIGNHAPRLKGRSKAMERRLRIVPFKHRPKVADQKLKENLRSEAPAILRWMIEGCLQWQRTGLRSAPAVDAETSAYFEQQDTFGRWLEERCLIDQTLSGKPSNLLSDFISWGKDNNELPVTSVEFREMIERTQGLKYVKIQGDRSVKGIGLKPTPGQAERQNKRYGDHDDTPFN